MVLYNVLQYYSLLKEYTFNLVIIQSLLRQLLDMQIEGHLYIM
jgi:hypothetical protein